jgi:nicotinamide riboside transporter PnuC
MKLSTFDMVCGFGTVLMVIGTIINASLIKECFLFWIGSNIIFAYREHSKKDKLMTFVFIILIVSSIYGFINWSLKV